MTGEIEGLVRRILIAAAGVALLAAGLGAAFAGLPLALGVLLGAALACGSFLLMQRDVGRLLAQVAEEAAAGGEGASISLGALLKLGFWLKSFGRLTVLALLLIVLAVKTAIHPIGLVLGLTALPLGAVWGGLAGKRQRRFGIPD